MAPATTSSMPADGASTVPKAGKGKGKGNFGRSGVARKPAQSRSSRAGLQFPVGRINRFLRRFTRTKRQTPTAGVYMAAVVEYLVVEVLELAGNIARDLKKKRIIPRHITLAVRGDSELNELTRGCTISGGGVIPHIHYSLIPKKKEKTETTGEKTTTSTTPKLKTAADVIAKKKKKSKTTTTPKKTKKKADSAEESLSSSPDAEAASTTLAAMPSQSQAQMAMSDE